MNRGENNGKSFAVWINNPAHVRDKASFVKIHLIPTDERLLTEDKFDEFIEVRAKLIISKI